MPSQADYLFMASGAEKKAHLERQWRSAVDERRIACECGQVRALELAYRCLYCGAWFCVPCAELHFGMTVQAWKEKKRAERVAAYLQWKAEHPEVTVLTIGELAAAVPPKP